MKKLSHVANDGNITIFNVNSILLLLSCGFISLFPPISYANGLELKFGGWSHHGKSFSTDDYDYSEVHNGIGIEYFFGGKNWKPVIGVWTMEDSFKERLFQVGVGYRYRPDFLGGRISAQLMLAYERRGERVVSLNTGDTKEIHITNQLQVIPYLHFVLIPSIGAAVDFTYVPRLSETDVETFFIRFSISPQAVRKTFL
ncbi:hypothetical protein L4D09_11450 [Photobacterium makurazakiensis]|uniref:hypothetical protein n=1 Tax=Photobacterium makurazakiensis TaxID=2910234 RepID=UPI003D0DE07E